MSDIVERLRTGMGGLGTAAVMREALDEIERLRAENERLREQRSSTLIDEIERLRAENWRLVAALRETADSEGCGCPCCAGWIYEARRAMEEK